MKKSICLLGILLLLGIKAEAQDLIVTKTGDSINCKIKSVKKDYIYFTFKHKNEVRNTLLQTKQVKDFRYKFFQEVLVPETNALQNDIYKHWKFSFTGGYGYRTAKTAENLPSTFEDYIDKLRSGFNLNLDLDYYMRETFSLGFQYSYFSTRHSMKNVEVPGFGSNDIVDNISLSFFGPSFGFRSFNISRTNCFYMHMALGYLTYKDDGSIGYNDVLIKGSTVGLKYDLGYDFGISENISLGLQLGYVAGTLTKIDATTSSGTQSVKLDKEEYENLGRIDVSVGIKFNW